MDFSNLFRWRFWSLCLVSATLGGTLSVLFPPAVAGAGVGFNGTDRLPGHWIVHWPDGIVLAVSEPFEKYRKIGAPTFDVWIYNFGGEAVEIGYDNFAVMEGETVTAVNDGEPPLDRHRLEPAQRAWGRITYYGGTADALIIRRNGREAVIRINDGSYDTIERIGDLISSLAAYAIVRNPKSDPKNAKTIKRVFVSNQPGFSTVQSLLPATSSGRIPRESA